jgi:probable rRNA maturation factor
MNNPLPTDVLAFPLWDETPPDDAPDPNLGDIIISVEMAQSQAEVRGHSFDDEITLLLIHGFLHLVGYEDQSASQNRIMLRETRKILKDLKKKDIT